MKKMETEVCRIVYAPGAPDHVAVFTDIHKYAPNEIPMREPGDGEAVIYLGDIVDMAYCKEEMWEVALKDISDYSRHTYIYGNHERAGNIERLAIMGKTLFAHGDMQSNPDKWGAYRQKPFGAGFFKRNIFAKIIEIAEKVIERPMKKEFLDRAAALAKEYGCVTYVCGHFHVRSIEMAIHRGIKIVVLPRGESRVYIE